MCRTFKGSITGRVRLLGILLLAFAAAAGVGLNSPRTSHADSPPPFLTAWGDYSSIGEPLALAVDGNGNVYIVESSTVEKFTSTGTLLTSWSTSVAGQGVAVDSSGNVYVTEFSGPQVYGVDRVEKFSSTGVLLTAWGGYGSGDGQLWGPDGVAVDSSGNVYVADRYNKRIQKFTSSGAYLTQWGSGDGQFCGGPTGVATDGAGNVYVGDPGNSRVQEFTSTGSFLRSFNGVSGGSCTGYAVWVGVAVDSIGNVYVADIDDNRITKVSSTGAFLTAWGSFGSTDGQFKDPLGVAVDSSGNLYVADTLNYRIQVFGSGSQSLVPPPAGTTISPSRTESGGIPMVNWEATLTLSAQGCSGGTAIYQIDQGGTPITSGNMVGSGGTYIGTIPPLYPAHFQVRVSIIIICPGDSSQTIAFDMYIDPSGAVKTVDGTPIPGATVMLLSAPSTSGPFTPVPNGSSVMSLINRNNPDMTDSAGAFGWDVVAGVYEVQASKAGCVSAADPAQAAATSAVLTVPPAITNLDLRLNCDSTPPTTTATLTPPANAAGWNNGPVTVTLTAADSAGGSGVASTFYALDSVTCTPAARASCSTYQNPIPVSGEGKHTLTFFSTDKAGNVEAVQSQTVKIDQTAPTANPRVSQGTAGTGGWYTSDVAIAWNWTDSAGGSGIDAAACTMSSTSSGEGTLNLAATCKDLAGNQGSAGFTVKVDKTPPAVVCASADTSWHAADVSIPCTASDGTVSSGLASAADASFNLTTSVAAGTEASNAATGSHPVCDVAGNCATAGPVSGNKVDKKAPAITVTAPATTGYLLNQIVTADYSCLDGGSGVATCMGPVANGSAIDTATAGSKTFTVKATDNAGNAAMQTMSYTVAYKICVLYDQTKAAQAGSVIPIKLFLCDASGADVSTSSIVVHATGVTQVSTNAAGTLASAGDANPDNDFRFDATLGPAGGSIYNLSTNGLATGTYSLSFSVSGDPTTHTVKFEVR